HLAGDGLRRVARRRWISRAARCLRRLPAMPDDQREQRIGLGRCVVDGGRAVGCGAIDSCLVVSVVGGAARKCQGENNKDRLHAPRTFAVATCRGRFDILPSRMDWLNYHHLLYFWMVAKHGSITRASTELRLAHPTISGQIHQLEEAL